MRGNRLSLAAAGLAALALAVVGLLTPIRAQNVVATIPLTFSPGALAVNPTTHRVYAASSTDATTGPGNSVGVIDGTSGSVVATIAVGPQATGIAVNPATNRVYVAEVTESGALGVVDGSSNRVIATIPLSVPSDPVVNPTTNRVYVAVDETPNRDLAIIDGATNTVLSHSQNGGAGLMALNPTTNQLYVYDAHHELVRRADAMGNIGPEVSSGGYVSSLALDPTSNRLYLAHLITGEVTALDGTTLATVGTVPLPAIPQSVAINPATSRVYTANNNGTLSIIDARTDAVVATVAVQSNPSAVAVDPTLNRVYVANAGSNSVSVIDNPATPPSPTPVATEVPHDGRYFPQTGFRVDDDAVWDYFVHRGGIANFGYPVSRTFRFQGHPVQFFQRRIVELDDNGHPRLLNLLDGGLMPYASFNQAQMPAFDPALVGTAPPTTDAPATLAFVRAHAPDTFAGLPVDFFHTFANTVTPAVAFGPAGGDPSLLPGFNLELWGIPTSAPAFDPHDHNFVYLRFQRGIMMYDAGCACTQGVLLADYLKGILTGQNLPSDLAREAQDSPFFRQYDPGQPNWVHNPELLANSDLTNAFTPE